MLSGGRFWSKGQANGTENTGAPFARSGERCCYEKGLRLLPEHMSLGLLMIMDDYASQVSVFG